MQAEASRPYVLGETDCAAICARWVELRAGVNPIDHYGRMNLLHWDSQLGGLPAAVRRVMRKAGFKRTADPQPGDIGVLVTPRMAVAAVRGSSVWLWREKGRGLCAFPAAQIQPRFAWSIECLQSSPS